MWGPKLHCARKLTNPWNRCIWLGLNCYIPYFRYYKTPLYLFLRLFGASSIQEGLIFKKFLNWMNKIGKIWQKIGKNSQFWIFFQINHVIKPSEWIIMSRFHMEMFWGFQKGIIHVSIPNGCCGVRSYNQEGLIFIFKAFWCVFYSRGSSIQERLMIARIRYVVEMHKFTWPFPTPLTITYTPC